MQLFFTPPGTLFSKQEDLGGIKPPSVFDRVRCLKRTGRPPPPVAFVAHDVFDPSQAAIAVWKM